MVVFDLFHTSMPSEGLRRLRQAMSTRKRSDGMRQGDKEKREEGRKGER